MTLSCDMHLWSFTQSADFINSLDAVTTTNNTNTEMVASLSNAMVPFDASEISSPTKDAKGLKSLADVLAKPSSRQSKSVNC